MAAARVLFRRQQAQQHVDQALLQVVEAARAAAQHMLDFASPNVLPDGLGVWGLRGVVRFRALPFIHLLMP